MVLQQVLFERSVQSSFSVGGLAVENSIWSFLDFMKLSQLGWTT